MSYILDALNKSEKEKRRHRAPDLGVVHREPAPQRPTSFWMRMVFVFLALSVVGGGAYWLGISTGDSPATGLKESGLITQDSLARGNSDAKPVADASTTTGLTRTNSTDQPPGNTTGPEQARIAPEAATQKFDSPPANASATGEPDSPATTRVNPPGELITPQDFFNRQKPAPPPAAERDVTRIAELPPSIQRQIPDLTFSSHIYSDEPTFRMVNINGRSLREGDMIADGIKLVEISEEGVIMSYLHYTFEVSVLRDWSFN
ncbi:MAG: general secretion pathway protein GspB [Pseudomonadota bacterium]